VLALAALIAFLATGTAIRRLIPPPWFEVTAKLSDLERRGGEIDAVFIGNSRIYRGLVPQAFDERLAERGLELTSYNLGGPGMGSWETNRTLERLLATGGLDLDYVFLQVGSFGARVEEQERDTRRGVDWHTPRHTFWVLRAALRETSFTTGDRLRALREHAGYFLRWLVSYGMALDAWRHWTGFDSDEVSEMMQLVARERGFVPLGVYEPNVGRRDRFLDRLDKFSERVERGRQRNRRKHRARQFEHDNPEPLAAQIARLEAAGIQPVFLVEPQYGAGFRFESLVDSGLLPNLLNVDDPRRYPHLFRADRHYDKGHLNQRGANEFSAALADQFADWLESR
jgi:hypothetical protein